LVSLPDVRRVDEVGIDYRFDLSRSGKIAATQHADSTDGMQHARLSPRTSDPLPPRFADRLAVFADLFTRPTWSHALVLLAGAILAPGRRTVTAVLRILGRERDGGFCMRHPALNSLDF
jgi:hypothetical protein